MKIRIADLNVEIHNRYPHIERLCRDYLCSFEKADISVTVTPEEIERELAGGGEDAPHTPGYAESICAYRAIAMELPRFGAFVFHAAVVARGGRGYAFAAHSGTGKTTHIMLWKKLFGDDVTVVNGDKPILRFVGDQLFAYGTPWCGKERLQENTRVELAALAFLERAKENAIRPIDNGEAVQRVFSQVVMPDTRDAVLLFLDLLDRTIKTLPTYLLSCNMELEAARVAYRGMNKGEDHDPK